MAGLWLDLVHTCRRLRRSLGFLIASVLTLALGIGGTTAVFCHVNNVLFKGFEVPAGDRVVSVVLTNAGRFLPSQPGLMQRQLPLFFARPLSQVDDIATVFSFRTVPSAAGAPELVSVEAVSGNYFQVLGVQPLVGRTLTRADDRLPDSIPVLISERLWRARYGGDPHAVGQTLKMGGRPVTLVGVLPGTFRGTWIPTIFGHDIWAPRVAASAFGQVLFDPTLNGVIARLKPGVGLAQADAEARSAGRGFDPQKSDWGTAMRPLSDAMGAPPQLSHVGWVVLALSLIVVAIACANLTNLLLARGAARTEELAIRRALGASRTHLARLIAMESGVVSVLGGMAGWVVASLTARTVGAIPLPIVSGRVLRYDTTPDTEVAIYASVVTLGAALVVGLACSRGLGPGEGPETSSISHASFSSVRSSVRSWLVTLQAAGGVMLLIVAALLGRTALASVAFTPNVDTQHTAVAQLNLGLSRYDEKEAPAVVSRILNESSLVPGVSIAALTSGLPIGRRGEAVAVLAEGRHVGLISRGISCRRLSVSPGFFSAIQLPFKAGRDIREDDDQGRPEIAVVSESLAAAVWPGQGSVGQRFRIRDFPEEGPLLEVVGVVADMEEPGANPETRRFLFVPLAQQYRAKLELVVRGQEPPANLLRRVHAALDLRVPDVPLFNLRTLHEALDDEFGFFRAAPVLFLALGIVAIVVAVTGVYAMLSYLVALRLPEFGIRQAMGAGRWDLFRLVTHEGLSMLVRGTACGVAVAIPLPWVIPLFLVGTAPDFDPWAYVLASIVVLGSGVLACIAPAIRAARLDPNDALRELR